MQQGMIIEFLDSELLCLKVSIGACNWANLRGFPGGWQGTHAWWDHKLCAVAAAASWGEDSTYIWLHNTVIARNSNQFCCLLHFQFLSMKLATVNPQLDFSNLSTLLHKDVSLNCIISDAL